MNREGDLHEIESGKRVAHLQNRLKSSGKPVLFIHGFNSSEKIWYSKKKSKDSTRFAERAFELGRDVWSLNFSHSKSVDIRTLALQEIFPSLKYIHGQRKGEKIDIVSHSMGGIYCRFLFSENFEEKKEKCREAEEIVDSVTMLATPNHGINIKRIRKILDSQDWVSTFERRLKATDFKFVKKQTNRAFWQILQGSDFLNQLNKSPRLLNPKISWKNGIATKDILVEYSSAEFSSEEVSNLKNVDLEQKYFETVHMKNLLHFLPIFSESSSEDIFAVIRRGLEKLFPKEIPYLLRAPIYASEEVFDWTFESG